MKVIGLRGGMSWESTVEYYRLINESVRERLGGLHSAQCILYAVDFAEVAELQRRGQWAEAAQLLVNAAQKVERAGANVVLICTNTMHKLADTVQAFSRRGLCVDATGKRSPSPMKLEFAPIGGIHSPHRQAAGTPLQPRYAEAVEGTL